MILFFDACSSCWYIALYTPERTEIASQKFQIAWNESSKAIALIRWFLQEQGVDYTDIHNIVCVNGPGSFTGIRTISLIVNTLAFIYPHISLTPIGFFDLFDEYPIVKASSKRDLFVKYQKWDIIQIEKNSIFEEKFRGKEIFGDIRSDVFERDIHVNAEVDYMSICKHLTLQNNTKIAPLYIKKPNIS